MCKTREVQEQYCHSFYYYHHYYFKLQFVPGLPSGLFQDCVRKIIALWSSLSDFQVSDTTGYNVTLKFLFVAQASS